MAGGGGGDLGRRLTIRISEVLVVLEAILIMSAVKDR